MPEFFRPDRIEALLKEKGITKNELLTATKQSPNNFSRWEKGTKPSYTSLLTIADYLGVDVNYLAGITDSPHGEAVIEEATDYFMDAGVDVHPFDNDTGVGQEYALTYLGKTLNFQQHEYRDLCDQLMTFIHDAEMDAVDKFCRNYFKITDSETDLTDDETMLLDSYRRLSTEGKTMVKAKIIEELRRQE